MIHTILGYRRQSGDGFPRNSTFKLQVLYLFIVLIICDSLPISSRICCSSMCLEFLCNTINLTDIIDPV